MRKFLILIGLLLTLIPALHAEEGMWLFSAPPQKELQATYGFELTPAWLDHLMQSAVKVGASASFVSADGLVMTNHHVGRGSLQQLSTAEHNYARDGYMAKSLDDELKVPGMELNVLREIVDVTARVIAAVPGNLTGEPAALARRKVFAEIEAGSMSTTGLKSEVVTLYQGGQYHLYRYQRYTDVRLVFAPESAIAAFGGDPDNFEYPRYCLDVCFFRAYENNHPAHPTHFLKWSSEGAKEGDLIFVAGHPGHTDRLLTVAETAFIRDVQLPWTLGNLYRQEVALTTWGARSAENNRRAAKVLLGVQNSRKAREGQFQALQDPDFMARKASAEAELRGQLPQAAALDPYGKIAAAERELARNYRRRQLLEGAAAFASQSFTFARTLLRAGEETPKPNGERLPDYTDARRSTLERDLLSPAPVYEDLEILRLTVALSLLASELGSDDPTVRAVLGSRSPHARAVELITGTRVRDLAFRKKLLEGGAPVVAAAHDPMIELGRSVDAESRALRRAAETQEEIIVQSHAVLATQRFAIAGTAQPPDATGTLRLTYGTVKGYVEDGQPIPALTTVAGVYERSQAHDGHAPFDLPPRWLAKRSALDPSTPFNFVCTCDIIGGNSGSPVVNRNGEVVGLIFDGNLPSLAGDFAYDDRQGRALAVHSALILEALRRVYDFPALADELTQGQRDPLAH